MPLYEYECDNEGHRFEKIQKFSDPPIGTCPVCGSTVRRLVSSPAIQFKGSGWYITDYARAAKNDGTKAEASSKKGDAPSSSESKTDSPAKSTESTPAVKSGSKAASTTS